MVFKVNRNPSLVSYSLLRKVLQGTGKADFVRGTVAGPNDVGVSKRVLNSAIQRQFLR